MKKILLSLIISGASVCSFAQPTWDFETWTGSGTGLEPSGWVSENAAVAPPLLNNPQSVFQAISPDIHGGTYAMQITSVTMTTNPAPGQLPNPIGLAATGVVNLSPAKLIFGFPYTARTASVSFWEKYTPASGGDTAGLFVSLTKWNTSVSPQKRDTIAIGLWKSGATTTNYTTQTVTLTYFSTTLIPDSAALIFTSTKLFNPNNTLCMACGKAGSNLWVDDVSFAGWNAVSEIEMSKGVSVFPNPSSDLTTITVEDLNEASLVEVFDITGRSITTISLSEAASGLNKKSATIITQGMNAGLYSLSVYDKNKHILRSGKLNVVK